MKDKRNLTEKLKVVETKVYDGKIDLSSIQMKLNNSYAYETELLERLETCRKETAELHKKFTLKAAYISELFKDMRSILDIFTGNFYSN